jgi:hypothetical protein
MMMIIMMIIILRKSITVSPINLCPLFVNLILCFKLQAKTTEHETTNSPVGSALLLQKFKASPKGRVLVLRCQENQEISVETEERRFIE